MKHLLGVAIKDYFENNLKSKVFSQTNLSEDEEFPVDYFFRKIEEMPALEQAALELAYGKVLDVGCGAGAHSMYLQNVPSVERVDAIDVSEEAISVCQARGIANAKVQDVMSCQGKYDTILLLMNGTGICGKLSNLQHFLKHLKTLLAPNGQILVDSSDLIYLFEKENGEFVVPKSEKYYGEVEFTVKYNGETERLDWLYLSYDKLEQAAKKAKLQCEKIADGSHFDYLARLY
ncbi:class I SAM-dependent methyltransferase [Ornithobacterium rhinotracheale]|uniref:class I SAM-dependent methyltransferase n=1 Tax=Ornithobacterium rhinotracheale TaxID=28251 RepID=UPI00129C23CC|nr:class I SAM-dependent methyltransferase [Ornithobacterium rhinotracheale]MRJ08515.1 class I SAM-dependent methyltransferase [Ornithobacterium rhinotracheale]MRJ10118.1 class I SAM-dependent methyltransferase [Ornithobacterium rhinotracheale]UOH76790.1 class I SAM-dependent methyltransferase [Ornithobacterium rhinotracheale]